VSDVTDGDRERARELLRSIAVGTETYTTEMVAASLAEERERARVPFLALADELDRDTFEDEDEAWAAGQRYSAGRIRAALSVPLAGQRVLTRVLTQCILEP
jgi:hypothetical protein